MLAVTQVICGRYRGAFDLNVLTVHMGLNFDEPHLGGIQKPVGLSGPVRTPHNMKAQNKTIMSYLYYLYNV